MSILNSITIKKYKNTMNECIRMYYPQVDPRELDHIINYSIQKRYKETQAQIDNSYTKKKADMTLLAISDYADGYPSEKQVNDYMSLALHLVQNIKCFGEFKEEGEM